MDKQLLLMVTGLPGTGKTTFAMALAKHLEFTHFNSDMLRAEVGMKGRYDAGAKQLIYTTLLTHVTAELQTGNSVIVDATFSKEYLRSPFQKIGSQFNVPVVWIELRAAEQNIKKRVGQHRPYSEADYEVYLRMKKDYEPLGIGHLSFWTDRLTIPEMIKETEETLSLFTKPISDETY